jgi:hypothetical protein
VEPRKEITAKENTAANDIFLMLPRDLKIYLCSFLCTQDFLNLILATRSFIPAYPYLAKRADYPLRKLLSHAALGEWEAAEAIWSTQSPCLLSFRGTIFHPNRFYENDQVVAVIPVTMHPGCYKYVNHSVWQIALMNEEFEEAEQIGLRMSEEEKCKQFMEIFPTGKIVKENWDFAEAKRRLMAAFEAIINDETLDENNFDIMKDATRATLYALYDYVKPAPEHKTGLVFDANIYVEALQCYEDKYKQFKNWNQRSFWCVRIEGRLAAQLATRYKRPHAQGIGNPLHRRGCVLGDGTSVSPFRRVDKQIDGFHFFVGYCGGAASTGGGAGGRRFFQNLCRATTREGESLRSAIFAKRSRHV